MSLRGLSSVLFCRVAEMKDERLAERRRVSTLSVSEYTQSSAVSHVADLFPLTYLTPIC